MSSDTDLFSASIGAIESSKRVEKFQRFFTEFQRECEITLNNAQEWIKAELPIVANYIDIAPLKEELKSNKTTTRRKHLLSALIFEQATRDAVHKHQAAKATLMAMHMINHIWQAKLEMHEDLATSMAASRKAKAARKVFKTKSKEQQAHDLKREQILTSLIKKGELQKTESQIQKQNATAIRQNPLHKPKKAVPTRKNNSMTKFEKELWKESKYEEDEANLTITKKFTKPKKKYTKKKKTDGMFSKVRKKIPMKRSQKNKSSKIAPSTPKTKPHDSLLDNPNNSAIMVSPGLFKEIDDSLIQARPRFSDDPNESGITVRKVLKSREHKKQEPGSNTIIMKLASSAGGKRTADMSVPEQCQHAVNYFCELFPGYDIVAIRNMAAEKVGVSPQYIENLNILPEDTK